MAQTNSDYEALAQSIDALLLQYQRARAENVALQKKMRELNNEKALLKRKNEEARRRVEMLIKSLRKAG
ncbi:MAG: hypothetical protein D6698_02550 [Gammaproteobacteria bacterium]|nr:MAG: hypothetical protein D6698_02550 [Gammaproteobacteria bacterium]